MPVVSGSVGALRERLTFLQNVAPALLLASLTRVGTVATAQTTAAHGYATGDYVIVAGAVPSGYNGKQKIVALSSTQFTYTVTNGLATPATGTITATYANDAQGGRAAKWSEVVSGLAAELIPVRATERLQLAAIQSTTTTTFRVYRRVDLNVGMRVQWTPSWNRQAPLQTLEVTGLLPDGFDLRFLLVDCTAVAPAV